MLQPSRFGRARLDLHLHNVYHACMHRQFDKRAFDRVFKSGLAAESVLDLYKTIRLGGRSRKAASVKVNRLAVILSLPPQCPSLARIPILGLPLHKLCIIMMPHDLIVLIPPHKRTPRDLLLLPLPPRLLQAHLPPFRIQPRPKCNDVFPRREGFEAMYRAGFDNQVVEVGAVFLEESVDVGVGEVGFVDAWGEDGIRGMVSGRWSVRQGRLMMGMGRENMGWRRETDQSKNSLDPWDP